MTTAEKIDSAISNKYFTLFKEGLFYKCYNEDAMVFVKYELQVFKDVYTLVKKVFLYTQDFPREYKYTLGQDMKRDAIQLVRSIYRANKAKNKDDNNETLTAHNKNGEIWC